MYYRGSASVPHLKVNCASNHIHASFVSSTCPEIWDLHRQMG